MNKAVRNRVIHVLLALPVVVFLGFAILNAAKEDSCIHACKAKPNLILDKKLNSWTGEAK